MSVAAFTSPSELTDEELALRFQAGDAAAMEALIQRYRRFARAKTRTYFLVGGGLRGRGTGGTDRPLQGGPRFPGRSPVVVPGLRRVVA